MNLDAISGVVSNQFERTTKSDATMKNLQGMDPSKMSKDQIHAVANDFEVLFINEMMQHMMGESMGESAFGSEETDEIYKSMMTDNYAKAITKAGGIGIAGYIERALNERALLSTQEV